MEKKGRIEVNSENILPIIKKWLYSDKDIFLRELVSNAADAITKFKKLVDLGEASAAEGETYSVRIVTDKENKTLKISDNGIGMTAEELEQYIAQVAFSGAADFVKKYENSSGDGIIGHFGLGFYSAYMVAKEIEVDSLSFRAGAGAAKFVSDGESDYVVSESSRAERGTEITLHLAEGEEEFLEEHRIRELIRKYCAFMPYPVYLNPKDGEESKPLNNTAPLWEKDPKECTDEEYESFYSELFFDFSKPLFWIHLNVDYPFKLKGILYFPKQKNPLEVEKGEVKLFCNRVFVADNIKEVIPEFLMLLKGVIDCPDIPLNVSRSFLQNDREVQKISKHITKKVADKLNALFSGDRDKYVGCWEDISPFVKFGCLKDEEFYDKVKKSIVYKTLDGEYKTLEEYYGEEKTVYYVSDEDKQSQYVKLFREGGMKAVVLGHFIDSHFISFLEYKEQGYSFRRIDSEVGEALKSGEKSEGSDALAEVFKEDLRDKEIKVVCESLKNRDLPAIVNIPEMSRRFREMSRMYAGDMPNDAEGKDLTLVLNSDSALIQAVPGLGEDKRKIVVNQIYDLAMLSFKKLNAEQMGDFLGRSYELLKNFIG